MKLEKDRGERRLKDRGEKKLKDREFQEEKKNNAPSNWLLRKD